MTNTFKTQQLASNRVLVTGTDYTGAPHQVVLDGSELAFYKKREAAKQAAETFDTAVEEFFAPLTEAADVVARALNADDTDEAFYLVEQEETEGVVGNREVRTRLTGDSVILRILESGDHSRLIWVGEGIELLAKVAPAEVDTTEAIDLSDVLNGHVDN